MGIFKLYNCDVGIKVDGVGYNFTHVKSVVTETTKKNKLTRGANAGNNVGLAYVEGLKDPDKITIPIMQMSAALKAVLDGVFANQTRVEVYVISREDGASKTANNAILCNRPQQLTLDDSADSMDVQLEFESFDVDEVHKS